MKNTTLKGGIYVALVASGYGMLTTFITLANREGFTTFELTFCQYFIGFLGLLLVDYFKSTKRKTDENTTCKIRKKHKRNLILVGSSLGFTSLIYYFSVQFISVSIAIVLLMQSVWISVVLDILINKIKPGKLKIIAVIIVLMGTVLATNLLFDSVKTDWRGLALGFLAAISYSITIFSTNSVATNLPAITRSKWMALGALILVAIVALPFMLTEFHLEVIWRWGIMLGVLGAFLPPLLLNAGMPKINLGVGAIITSLELPVAISMACLLLHESVNVYQLLGVALILSAIVMMNLRSLNKRKTKRVDKRKI